MAVHRGKGVAVISLASGNRHKIAGFVIPFPTGDGLHDLAGIAVPRDQIALGVDGDVAAAVGTRRVERAVGLHKAACGEPFVGKLRADVLAQQRAQLVERVHVAQRDAGEGKTVHRDAGRAAVHGRGGHVEP